MSDPFDGLLSRLSETHAATHGDQTALIFGAQKWSWNAFHDAVLRAVSAMRGAGLRPGGRVAFLGYNSDQYAVLLQACYRGGFVCLPLNWRMAPMEIEYLLRKGNAAILVFDADFTTIVEALAPDALPPLVLTAAGDPGVFSSFSGWLQRHQPDARDPVSDPETIAVLLYTSGTSGFPKGALLCHRNISSGFMDGVNTGEAWGIWNFETVTLVATPVFHVGGTGALTQGLLAGATIVILPRPDVPSMVNAISRHRVTRLFVVPALLNMILHDPAAAAADFSSVRIVCYGASPIPLEILRRSMQKFPGADFVQLYGMTETSGVATWLPAADHDPAGNQRMASCGKAFPGTDIIILGTDGAVLPPGKTGEIAIRSGCVMHGYLDDRTATAAAIVGGFYRTGDAGFVDADGYLYINDRVKDMIVSGGENIYPNEIERALASHPDVADCAVIGIPDERWGEAVLAFVVPRGAAPDAEMLKQHLQGKIGRFKIPKQFHFVAELPRNASGKILKRELRKPFWENQTRLVG